MARGPRPRFAPCTDFRARHAPVGRPDSLHRSNAADLQHASPQQTGLDPRRLQWPRRRSLRLPRQMGCRSPPWPPCPASLAINQNNSLALPRSSAELSLFGLTEPAARALGTCLETITPLRDNGRLQIELIVSAGPGGPYDYLYRTDRRRKYQRDACAGRTGHPRSRDCRDLWNKRGEGRAAVPRVRRQALLRGEPILCSPPGGTRGPSHALS